MTMKEQLIRFFERQEHYMRIGEEKKVFFDQAFGAISFALQLINDTDEEYDFIIWWEEEWKPRFLELCYGG